MIFNKARICYRHEDLLFRMSNSLRQRVVWVCGAEGNRGSVETSSSVKLLKDAPMQDLLGMTMGWTSDALGRVLAL